MLLEKNFTKIPIKRSEILNRQVAFAAQPTEEF